MLAVRAATTAEIQNRRSAFRLVGFRFPEDHIHEFELLITSSFSNGWIRRRRTVYGPMETRKSSDKGLIDGYREKLKAGNVSEKIASGTASAEIAAQVSETNAILQYRIAEIGRWYEPDKLMGYFVAICMGQGGWGLERPIRWRDLNRSHPIWWCRSISPSGV